MTTTSSLREKLDALDLAFATVEALNHSATTPSLPGLDEQVASERWALIDTAVSALVRVGYTEREARSIIA